MRKLFAATIILAIGMLLQGFADKKAFHKRSVGVAKNSFETGCIVEAQNSCWNYFPNSYDKDVIHRGYCLEASLKHCSHQADLFGKAFDSGPK